MQCTGYLWPMIGVMFLVRCYLFYRNSSTVSSSIVKNVEGRVLLKKREKVLDEYEQQ